MYCNWKVNIDLQLLEVESRCTVTGRCKLVYCNWDVQVGVLSLEGRSWCTVS